MHGEIGSAPSTEMWDTHIIPCILKKYAGKDIFNLDETSFYSEPRYNKTLASSDERPAGTKFNKSRITLVVGTNLTGTEKLPLVTVGKSKNPVSFKDKQLPVKYYAQQSAWMDTDIFNDMLRKMDADFVKAKRYSMRAFARTVSHALGDIGRFAC